MIIDANVWLSRWPFRRLPADDTPALVARLRQRGITQAWAASFDSVLHRDVAGVNARLAEECHRAGDGLLLPFGSVNLTLPDWQGDVRRCARQFHMRGFRLHPNYHGYRLDHPLFAALLAAATDEGLLVQIAVSMEDERTQHPLVRVPPVDVAPLQSALRQVPRARVMLLNWAPAYQETEVAPWGQLHFDTATVESLEGIARLLDRIPAERLLFGSNAPLFYLEAALLKMQESGLPPSTEAKIFHANAARLLEGAR